MVDEANDNAARVASDSGPGNLFAPMTVRDLRRALLDLDDDLEIVMEIQLDDDDANGTRDGDLVQVALRAARAEVRCSDTPYFYLYGDEEEDLDELNQSGRDG